MMLYKSRPEKEREIEKWLSKGYGVLLRGPRQSGKTTLMKHLQEKLGGTYVTLEDPDIRDLFSSNIKLFSRMYSDDPLFIDEVQYVQNAGKLLKYLYDVEKRVFVASGSGSFDIKVKISGYLAGRAHMVELLPLSFSEFVLWRDKKLYEIVRNNIEALEKILQGEKGEIHDVPHLRSLFEEYLMFGGYPAVVLESGFEEKREMLKDIVTSFVERDIGYFLGVVKKDALLRLMRAISLLQGSEVSYNVLSRDLGISLPTVRNYIALMKENMIIDVLGKYKGLLSSFRAKKKIYFIDQGLRNLLRGVFSLDGSSLEAHVFRILRKLGQVSYYRSRSGSEVDFVVDHERGPLPVEVKSTCRISKSLWAFVEKYKVKTGIVFCDRYGEVKKGDRTIVFIPHWAVG